MRKARALEGSHSKGKKGVILMGFKTDIEIAQECEMRPITEIAAKAGIDDKYLEQYGKYKAKIDYNLLKESDKKSKLFAALLMVIGLVLIRVCG